jgi:MerR family transcriptional regulator, thiopeptide resistance regulator
MVNVNVDVSGTARRSEDGDVTQSHYTVSEVAKLAHVSVRALHHYDDIGLLSPARRSAAGYRLYDDGDLRRLHEILLFRELGLPLDAIQRVLAAPEEERAAALRAHRRDLDERLERVQAVIRAVDARLDALERRTIMDPGTMFDGFDSFDHAQYAAEAEQRWGETEAYRESARRTKSYTKADWSAIKAEADAIMQRWGVLHEAGTDPTAAAAMEVAEQHRQHISRWFYTCAPEFHAGLADMFVADPRFRETFEKYGAGMTDFVAESIRANSVGRGTTSP